jgi:hypothetical protein
MKESEKSVSEFAMFFYKQPQKRQKSAGNLFPDLVVFIQIHSWFCQVIEEYKILDPAHL